MRYVALLSVVLLGGCVTINMQPPQSPSVTKADLAERDATIAEIVKWINKVQVKSAEEVKK